jgi:Fur family transcriptional regulator, ferric uptake regulator
MTDARDKEAARELARNRFQEYLRSRRLKVTSERWDVLDEVLASQDHFDARGIVRRIRSRGRHVSRATVYRTLDLLVDARLVSKLEFGDGEAHYEFLFGREQHEHLFCVRCGRIIEFSSPAIEAELAAIAKEFGFEARSRTVHVFGQCSRCRREADSAAAESGPEKA